MTRSTLQAGSSTVLGPAREQELAPERVAEIQVVFQKLTRNLGGKWSDLFKGVSSKGVIEEWSAALEGFDPVEVERGLHRVRSGYDYQLTSGAFAKLCRPALDPEFAFIEAGDCMSQRERGEAGDWTHPAVFRAACRMSMEVRAQDYRTCRKRWEYMLQKEFDAGWGDPVPPPAMRIAHEVRVGPPSLEVRQQMALIMRAPAVAAKLRQRVAANDGDSAEVERSERIAAIDWPASTPDQRAEVLGESFRNVRVIEAIPGVPVALVVDVAGRRAMLVGDLAAELEAITQKRAA